ncbi:MAG TPA: PH domain-containing protein, partial [Caulobacteraceae bacterium]|nr:PH domain-containing protein [Caulobacteraceae bacterium]
VVTNRRVIQLSGVFTKEVIDSALDKVTDVRTEQSLLGRMFNYGDVEVLTASETGKNLFRMIAEPLAFKRAMLDAQHALFHPAPGQG